MTDKTEPLPLFSEEIGELERLMAAQPKTTDPHYYVVPRHKLDRLLLSLKQERGGKDNAALEIVRLVLQDVCELPDRTSPDDQPDMLLVTTDELDMILRRHLGLEQEGILNRRSPLPEGSGSEDAIERAAKVLHDMGPRQRNGARYSKWENELPEYREWMREKVRAVAAALSPSLPVGGDGSAAQVPPPIASTAEAPAASGWRTIDSAPKDGTHVLLATSIDPPAWVCEGYHEADGDRGWYQANTHWTDAYEGLIYPSHWQPLPAPPLPEQEGASHTEEQGRSAAKPNERTPSETR